jgi:hypothetical protein
MDEQKQKTVKKHFFLVAFGTIAVLAFLSLTAPFDTGAPVMPADEAHQQTQRLQSCLNCHQNGATAVKPMKHEVRANCTFCHPRN